MRMVQHSLSMAEQLSQGSKAHLMIDMSKCLKSQRVVLKYWLIHIRLTCREKVGGSQRTPLLTLKKGESND